MSATFQNKREVRESVKKELQLYLADKLIETGDLTQLIKQVADAVEVPVASSVVLQVTLEKLLAFSKEANKDDATIATITTRLEEVKKGDAAAAQTTPEEPPQAEESETTSKEALLAEFRRKMAKKREEREKRQRESAPTTVPGSNVHTPSVSAPATPSVTPAVVPPAAVEELSLPQTSEAPPLKKVKEDDVVLILDDSEEDLYAGLSRYGADGSGRHHRPQYSNANNYYANQSGGNSSNSAGPSGGGYNYYQQQR